MFIQFTHTSTFRLLIACTVFILEVKFMNETETERHDRASRICDVSRGFLKDHSDHVVQFESIRTLFSTSHRATAEATLA